MYICNGVYICLPVIICHKICVVRPLHKCVPIFIPHADGNSLESFLVEQGGIRTTLFSFPQ